MKGGDGKVHGWQKSLYNTECTWKRPLKVYVYNILARVVKEVTYRRVSPEIRTLPKKQFKTFYLFKI
jgi:hypothetical protein